MGYDSPRDCMALMRGMTRYYVDEVDVESHLARRFEEILPHIVERYGAAGAVDLRFARRIIVQPSVEPGDRPRPRAGRSRPAPQTEHQEATTDHAQRG